MWKGIGEIFSHHDIVSWTTYGEVPRPDSEAYDMVYKFAAKYKMPVNIHSNITSSASASSPLPLFKNQMENAMRKNPETTFIWAHVGISNSLHVDNLPEIAAELLDKETADLAPFVRMLLKNYLSPSVIQQHLLAFSGCLQ